MNLSDQVVSLELSRRLKELGVKQRSLFWWVTFRNESSPKEQWANVYDVILNEDEKRDYRGRSYLKDKKFCSAFTVAELFDLLPPYIDIKKNEPFNNFWLNLQKRSASNIRYILNYRRDVYEPPDFLERLLLRNNTHDENLANALAKMLICLIENDLLPKENK